jgi:eukaryotic-like serine/threonine-protein kinase
MNAKRWNEIEKIFNAALEHEPANREAFLKEVCAEDESLRAEVESLLANDEQAGSLLKVPAMEVVARELATDSATLLSTSLIGKAVSHYHIVERLGKGGMGEVYQAKDQRLGRNVAIKVLPEEFAKDANRVLRFQREAKLLASLNHPNIAAIYGLEEFDGTKFLVLELVDGETLAEQLKRAPIAVEEALKLALQIAEALESAHEKGVIHRDLKPANIKITPAGKVKVLDFGLAKAFAGEQAGMNLSNSPTARDAATQQGVILGTAAYMSPEQALGKIVDKRADIWAFGCVLYEMLTGRRIWTGITMMAIIAEALAKDPDFSSLPPNIHPDIQKLLSRCLQKDPMERFRDIGDVRAEIKRFLADPKGALVRPVTTAESRTRLRTMLPWLAVAIVLSLIVGGAVVWKLKPPEPRQIMRYYYELPEGQELSRPEVPCIALSPDGKQFAYSTPKGLYISSVNDLSARVIVGTEENSQQPFFSPDSKWIAYFSVADHKLKKISINGGAPISLCDVLQLAGANWYEDNTIVYGQSPGDIMQISVKGGAPQSLVKSKGNFLYFPQILPNGKSVLYTSTTGGTDSKIRVQSLKSGESKELFAGVWAQYLPTGHIAYGLAHNNNLFVVPFDINKLEVTGGAVPIVQDILQIAVANAGTLIYLPGSAIAVENNQRILVWVDRKGKEEPFLMQPNFYKYPNISPDGTKVAITDYGERIHNIWVWDLIRKTLTKLTCEGKDNICPVWTPDGKRIAFFSFGHGSDGKASGVYWKPADGTGQDEQLSSIPDRLLFPYCWSSDGKKLVGAELTAAMDISHIGMLSMEGDHAQKTLVQKVPSEGSPKISLDGRWMAYMSGESGHAEVYVRPFPEVDKARYQISTSGGSSPLWSPDGRELFYRNGDAVMGVSVKTEPSFDIVGMPQVLFRGAFVGPDMGEGTPWDISPNSKRFLMIKRLPATTGDTTHATAAPRPKINIVLNWFEELKQNVPVK